MAGCLKPAEAHLTAEKNEFLGGVIAAPARRALKDKNINSLHRLSDFTENEIIQLHGFGKNTMTKLKTYMSEQQISFKINIKKDE